MYVCFRDMLENSSVHHAHHLSTIRSAVSNSPMNVLKEYKTFMKKKIHVNPALSLDDAVCKIFEGSENGAEGSEDPTATSGKASSESPLQTENLEFIALDEIKESVDNRSPSPEKVSSGFSLFNRKKGYESSS